MDTASKEQAPDPRSAGKMTEIRLRVERIVKDELVAERGAAAVVGVPLGPGYSTLVDRPADQLAAAATARRVAYAAEHLARDYAKRARAEGRSWAQVAQALQFDHDGHDDPGIAAFHWVAPTPSQPYDQVLLWWECATCGARVTDRGPFSGHPDDVEEGHRESCDRHLDEIKEFRQQTGWDD